MMSSNFYTDHTDDNIHPVQTDVPAAPKKKASVLTRRMALLLMCGSVTASGVLGFGGGVLAVRLNDTDTATVSLTSDITASDAVAPTAGSVQSAPVSGQSMSVSQIVQNVSNTVVAISTEVTSSNGWNQYSGTCSGSGVIISPDGYIVTNNHVVEDANSISVQLMDGSSYDARLIGTDSQTDLAVIKIEASGLTAAQIGSSDALMVGDEAIAIGNPLGELAGTVTNGIISALDREITIDGETHTVLQTNAAINQGNSGGGLFNNQGQLIGIVSAKSAGTGVEGLGYAIPIDLADPVINDLIENGYVTGRGYLGITIMDIQDAQTAFLYRVPQMGAYIASIENGSPAQAAGLKVGDCVLAVNDTEISSASELSKAIENSGSGSSVAIRVLRDGEEITCTATLAENVPSNI